MLLLHLALLLQQGHLIYKHNHEDQEMKKSYHGNLLFAYMEYTGTDYEKDMAQIAADPETQKWWKITAPMQVQVPEARDGEWWHTLHQNFYLD